MNGARQAIELKLNPIDPAAQVGAGLAGIDQFVHREGLRPGKGGAGAAQPLLEFAALGVRILGGGNLAVKGHRHAAFQGQRAGLHRGPGQHVGARRVVGGGGDAEALVNLDHGPRDAGLGRGGNRRHAVADGARRFRLGPDHEPRLIDEVDHRHMEAVAGLHEAAVLLGGLGGHGAGVVTVVVGEHADRLAGQAGEGADLARAIGGAHLKKRFPIDDQLQNGAHVKRGVGVARHRLKQFRGHALRIVIHGQARSPLPDRCGQIA